MSPLYFGRQALAALTLTLSAVMPATVLAQAKSLDQLLEQTRNTRAEEAKANAARVAKFQAEFSKQQEMLGQARGDKAAQERRAAGLNAAFDANEKKLTELQAQLDAKGGNLGELFGVTRTIANDFSSVVYNSIITAEFPDRDAFVSGLAKSKELPSIDELERLWFEMQREATESGKVVKYTGNVVLADGKPTQTDVVRIGPFNAVADGDYTSYLPSEKQLAVLSRQPGSPYSGLADDIMDAEATGYHEMTVDPTRGVLLAITVQRPNLVERIEQGELVGLIIIAVGIVGAVLGMYQLWYLLGVSRRVKAQLANLANPVDDNPLGRVLNAFKGDAAKLENDPEVVELRLSEAVLREVPMLERFQAFLRLAVAAGPLLGLVGTVVGMIITFQSITESGSGDPKLMAAGISQAMIATVLGLGIAVPLLFMNAVLMSRSKGIIQILDEQSTGLLAERLESRKGRG
jgi:biopolymer transport protein ExbB